MNQVFAFALKIGILCLEDFKLRIVTTVLALLTSAIALQAGAIVNDYSFTSNANDSVGGKNGTLQGTASVSGGALQLDGNGFVSLPNGLVSSLNSYSIETWITQSSASQPWSRIFDFGSSTSDYMFLTLNAAGLNLIRYGINAGPGEQTVDASITVTRNIEHYVALTYDAPSVTLKMYYDGALVGTGSTIAPSALGSTTNNYFGKSNFSDPNFQGSIDEFRIWNSALTAAQVSADLAQGPNIPTSTPEPATFGMIGFGLVSLGFLRKKR